MIITGQAISNTVSVNSVSNPSFSGLTGESSEGAPMPYVPVKIRISVKGFDRFYTVTTDSQGNFSYTFIPGSNEAGTYSLWAVHPDVTTRTIQSSFTIAGLSMSPETATVRMARNRSIDIPVSLYNYGGGALTGLTFETQTGTGITAGVINSGDNILTPGENQNITFRLTSSTSAPDTTYATMKASVNEGLSKTLNANISIVQLIPVITTSPSYIDTGMVRGNQKIATFNISNAGEETLRNARIEGPSTSWMTLTVNRGLGDIQPGVSKTIGIMFSPPATLAQGVYDDRVVIYSDNHIPYTYHIQVTVTSNAVGNVMFDVLNELMEDVPGATITLQHQTLTELIYTLKTAADGTVMQYDIPEGRYTYNVSPPPGHTPYSGTFIIQAGLTTTVPIALEMTMVTVTWSVTPTVIQDKYEIVITQTFETNVPAPVLITEPPSITLPELLPGQVFNGEFTVMNYGLIAVDNVRLEYPVSFSGYDIEIYTSAIPKRINAMQRITVPYRVTRRMQTACIQPSLLEEVMGYGGSSCLTSFNIITKGTAVICPNTAQQRTVEKSTAYTVAVPINCPASSSTGGYYVPPPSGGTYYTGGGTPTQTGVGGSVGSSPAPFKTVPCNCKEDCERDIGNCKPDEVCVGGKCTRVAIDKVDAKANGKDGGSVDITRPVNFTSGVSGENCEFVYEWDFGDGGRSNMANPTHKYTTPGSYNPSLGVHCKKCGPPPKMDALNINLCVSDGMKQACRERQVVVCDAGYGLDGTGFERLYCDVLNFFCEACDECTYCVNECAFEKWRNKATDCWSAAVKKCEYYGYDSNMCEGSQSSCHGQDILNCSLECFCISTPWIK